MRPRLIPELSSPVIHNIPRPDVRLRMKILRALTEPLVSDYVRSVCYWIRLSVCLPVTISCGYSRSIHSPVETVPIVIVCRGVDSRLYWLLHSYTRVDQAWGERRRGGAMMGRRRRSVRKVLIEIATLRHSP